MNAIYDSKVTQKHRYISTNIGYDTKNKKLISTPCPEKRTDSILAVTSTNFDNFSQFLA